MDLEKALIEFNAKFEVNPRYYCDLEWELYRFRFMLEELTEYAQASAEGNREDMLDALVDLVYVAIGTAVSQGFAFNEAFKRVHEANMKKVKGASKRYAYDIVKPEGWTPPKLGDLV